MWIADSLPSVMACCCEALRWAQQHFRAAIRVGSTAAFILFPQVQAGISKFCGCFSPLLRGKWGVWTRPQKAMLQYTSVIRHCRNEHSHAELQPDDVSATLACPLVICCHKV